MPIIKQVNHNATFKADTAFKGDRKCWFVRVSLRPLNYLKKNPWCKVGLGGKVRHNRYYTWKDLEYYTCININLNF